MTGDNVLYTCEILYLNQSLFGEEHEKQRDINIDIDYYIVTDDC